jgi:hypothetical protein
MLSSGQECYPYTWNNSLNSPLEVTFMGIPSDSHFIAFKRRTIDLKSTIPRYIFTNSKDFMDFQSAVRGKELVDSYNISKISSDSSGKYGDATDQQLKIWRDRETREYSVSFFPNVARRPRDFEFPFSAFRKDIEQFSRTGNLLRFEAITLDARDDASISHSRHPSKTMATESELIGSRYNTFGALDADETDSIGTATIFP